MKTVDVLEQVRARSAEVVVVEESLLESSHDVHELVELNLDLGVRYLLESLAL